MSLPKLTGNLFRAGRALAELTRDDLANRTGLSRDVLLSWEVSSESIVPAQYQMLCRVIEALESEGVCFSDNGVSLQRGGDWVYRGQEHHHRAPPDFPYAQAEWQQLEFAARSLHVNLRQLVVRRAGEFEDAFAAIARERPDVLLVTVSPLNFAYRRRIIELAIKGRLPTMSSFRVSRGRRPHVLRECQG